MRCGRNHTEVQEFLLGQAGPGAGGRLLAVVGCHWTFSLWDPLAPPPTDSAYSPPPLALLNWPQAFASVQLCGFIVAASAFERPVLVSFPSSHAGERDWTEAGVFSEKSPDLCSVCKAAEVGEHLCGEAPGWSWQVMLVKTLCEKT